MSPLRARTGSTAAADGEEGLGAIASEGMETWERFECFACACAVLVAGDASDGTQAREAAADAREALLEWHARFSRFLPDSELSRFNRDPRDTVPTSPLMARLALAVREAGAATRGLVDATQLAAIERAGYSEHLDAVDQLTLARALALAPERRAAAPSELALWKLIEVDFERLAVSRPPGVTIDSGGLAKGLFADVLGEQLAGHARFAVDCGGDLRLGGAAGTLRQVHVRSPFDESVLHTFELSRGGVATSGISRRSWIDGERRPAHHLLDPSSGRPAFTGVVQATALAPTALEAEVKAKAAVLSGPRHARGWLTHGGVVVFEDRSREVVAPPPEVNVEQLAGMLPRGLAGPRR